MVKFAPWSGSCCLLRVRASRSAPCHGGARVWNECATCRSSVLLPAGGRPMRSGCHHGGRHWYGCPGHLCHNQEQRINNDEEAEYVPPPPLQLRHAAATACCSSPCSSRCCHRPARRRHCPGPPLPTARRSVGPWLSPLAPPPQHRRGLRASLPPLLPPPGPPILPPPLPLPTPRCSFVRQHSHGLAVNDEHDPPLVGCGYRGSKVEWAFHSLSPH